MKLKAVSDKKENVNARWNAFCNVFLRELKRLASRPLYWFCVILAPLFCYVFFTSLMKSGLPTGLPLGLVDQDCTATSRQLARNLDAFQQTSITAQFASVREARKALQRGEIYGYYYIPKGTTKDAQRQEMPTVSFYTNNSYLVASSLLYRDMRTMSELASGAASRSVLYAKGATGRQAMAFLQPIVIDTHPLNNPWLNYSVYLCNVLLPGVLLLFVLLVTVHGIGIEIKEHTAREWLYESGFSMPVALAGKLLPQTFLFWLVGAAYVFLLYGVLRFPCNSGISVMLFVMAVSVCATQGLGVLMIGVLPVLRLGLSFASLWAVISFSISGMSYPVMAMHPALQGLCVLFPLRHYFILYVNCALDGYELLNAWPYLLSLFLFMLLPLLVMRRLKRVLLMAEYKP